MHKRSEVRILPASCKGCGICVHYCPSGVLEMSGEFTARGYHPPKKKQGAECKGCRICELMCPDFAIFIEEMKGEAQEARGPPGKASKDGAKKGVKGKNAPRPGGKGGGK